MSSNLLKINSNKTELMIVAPKAQLQKVGDLLLSIDGCSISPSNEVRNLGVIRLTLVHTAATPCTTQHSTLYTRRSERIFSSASRSVESEGQGCLSSWRGGLPVHLCCAAVGRFFSPGSRRETERLHIVARAGAPFFPPVQFCCGGDLLPLVVCCCPGEILPRGRNGDAGALRVRAAACFTPAVAEACIHLLHLSCSTVPRTFYHGDIAERPVRLYASS
ncbi:uncharacterized protein LOC117539536 [Gymnodraco acuticeps]|uniref:Uncharacterized protein LOC117539536 n=1 Tax=Gymnodraco acuticeps TaxID=8218 RepID=A0A6P8TCN9_GYMAC|nr:uncharacterized protein LOC117539536 [Gymnodraco acuticeps]